MKPQATHPKLRWSIAGCGAIADVFAASVAASGAGELVSVVGRLPERTRAFAARHGLRCDNTLADALVGVDAVYIATPNHLHHPMTLEALRVGVAVLCEKPYSPHAVDAQEALACSRRLGVAVAEAWMYRAHPAMQFLCGLISTGELGVLRGIGCWFGFAAEASERRGRLFDVAQGGGAILDVGGYPLSMAMLLAGAAAGSAWAAPGFMRCQRRIGESGVDLAAHAEVRFIDGPSASIHCAIDQPWGTGLTLAFDAGRVCVPDPFLPEGSRWGRRMHITILPDAGPPRTEVVAAAEDCYALEVRAFSRAVSGGAPAWAPPMVSPAETVALAHGLEVWRTQPCGNDCSTRLPDLDLVPKSPR